jgi:hypothetical protein
MKICKYYFLILPINLAHKKETKPSKQLPRNCVQMKKKIKTSTPPLQTPKTGLLKNTSKPTN